LLNEQGNIIGVFVNTIDSVIAKPETIKNFSEVKKQGWGLYNEFTKVSFGSLLDNGSWLATIGANLVSTKGATNHYENCLEHASGFSICGDIRRHYDKLQDKAQWGAPTGPGYYDVSKDKRWIQTFENVVVREKSPGELDVSPVKPTN
jgi:hypothetical protein